MSCLYTATGDYQCSNGSHDNGSGREHFYVQKPDVVWMFEHCEYNGGFVSKPVGQYKEKQMGIPPNTISSIKILPGYRVTVYDGNNFNGNSAVIQSDVECLRFYPTGDWNDRIRSYIVEKISSPVTMFEHCDFKGKNVSKGVGSYDTGRMGIENDSISSILVRPGYKVTVYEHDKLDKHVGTNRRRTFDTDVNCLYDIKFNAKRGVEPETWNDRISGYVVEKV